MECEELITVVKCKKPFSTDIFPELFYLVMQLLVQGMVEVNLIFLGPVLEAGFLPGLQGDEPLLKSFSDDLDCVLAI